VARLVELCYLMGRPRPANFLRTGDWTTMAEPQVTISARGLGRVQAGHPWVYRSDVQSAAAQPGDVVRVLNPQGRFVGRAFYSDRSQITLRMVTRDDVPVDHAFLLERLRSAAVRREAWVRDTEAYRLCYSEGDLLPSLIVDRYADVLVIQTVSQSTDRLKPEIVSVLVELLSPRGILERNDPRVRLREGLPQSVSVLYGDVPPAMPALMNGLRFEFDLFHGQKTGAFLDQRENYHAAAAYAFGEALDCFTYHGAFALSMASRCSQVEAIDLSSTAVRQASHNAELNQICNITFREANCFDVLRKYQDAGRRFDTIVLDPPAFAKDRRSVEAALRGYKEINLRSLKLLRPGGYLLTCSCSHHITETQFLQMLADAALDAKREATVVERRTQSRDHPIVLTVPETAYIKAFIIQAL
jgi:23S rRNA (cytosine1962-C5)-methyltransferase